jgi:MATE family multidrug resistance protein
MRNEPLSWEQKPGRELARLAWPITVSTISYSVMTLVDTLVVGHISPAALAGVGLGGTAAFAVLCFSFGVFRATKTLVAQSVGASRRDEAAAHVGTAIIAAVALGFVTTLFGELVAPLLPYLTATPEAGHAASTYLSIRTLGAPTALVYVALREVRYGLGDARSPMVATVMANLVNIGLCCLFVFGFHWGVAGAAWATMIAHSVEAGVLVWVQRQAGGFSFELARRRHFTALWAVGWPTAIQFSLEVGSFTVLAAMISSMSELQMAAHQIALQVVHFSFLPAYAVAEAGAVLVGQAVGANRDDLVVPISRRALSLGVIYTGVCSLVMVAFGRTIAAGFSDDSAVRTAATHLLWVAAVFQVFDAANIVARAALRGTGDVRFAALVGVSTAWAMTPPLTWLLGRHFGLGAVGGWVGLCGEIILGSLIVWARLSRGGWKQSASAARRELAAAT